ncbi:cell wall-binding repeat-containing protein [Dactylosporangium sp. NPDC005555]|uniref:cell wall-binding repeat-containing protein n=1 Tax=Dactylosporangium sp. NPDC005555 TaxID=3154889 RepID=UPI0033B6D094
MSFALTRRSALLGAAAAAAGLAVAPALNPGRRAGAALPGSPGRITFRRGTQIWSAKHDGTDQRVLADDAGGEVGGCGTWAPDGSRFVYSTGSTIESVRADGSEPFRVAGLYAGVVPDPAFTPDGSYIIAAGQGIMMEPAAPSNLMHATRWYFESPLDGKPYAHPALAADGTFVFEHGNAVHRVTGRTSSVQLIANAKAPDFDPDSSRIAFVRVVGGGDQIWIAYADGSNATQLTTAISTGSVANRDPAWSTDGTAILFTSVESGTPKIKRIHVGSRAVTTLVTNGSQPTCQPVRRNVVERVWGQTALGTAVAASRYNWADHDSGDTGDGVRAPAKAVVLSRDDTYLDALGGSALAVVKQGPLLITPPKKLHADTQAEMRRVLAPGGTVYLLGGTAALSAQVETQVQAMGFTAVRLWGQDEYETAVAIAKAVSPAPTKVMVATSLKYYDALAAGAAAGANPGAVVVLCAGERMPAATAAYLNTFDPDPFHDGGTEICAIGGPAMHAVINGKMAGQMPSWPITTLPRSLYGATEFETAVEVARYFFPVPTTAAVATAATWFDALTGGAMTGTNGGPLLLARAGDLTLPTQAYFSENSATLTRAVLLGGPLALKDSLIGPLGDAISVPGAYDYRQYTETSTTRA